MASLANLGQNVPDDSNYSALANLGQALLQTWPARLAKSVYSAVTLPGDVYAGKVDPLSDQGIGRAADLAGLVTLGARVIPPIPSQSGEMVLGSGMVRTGAAPTELYHVVGPEYEGGPLRSLYARKGDAAYDEFAQRWPEAGDLGQDHAHKVMFYDKLEDALSHADAFGGKVLRVDPSMVDALYLDTLEKSYGSPGFYATRSDVPAEALTPFEK